MYLGVDLGTSSVKLLLADCDGNLIDSESAGYPISYPRENWSEQNPEDWWAQFCRAVTALGSRRDLSALEAISFSGQMHGLVVLDERDAVIRPAILWNDGRTAEECAYLNDTVGRDRLIEWTGNVALTGFTAPKVLWMKKHEPEHFSKIAKLMLPKDYLAYRLTGVHATDVSDASGTLFFDVRNRRWSMPMLDILGLREDQLPKCLESASISGVIRAEIAAALHLPQSVRIVIGGGDQAMGAVGTGTVAPGRVSIQLGTSGVVFVNTEGFKLDPSAGMHSFCNGCGGYHMMGVTLSCAGSSKWWVEDVLKSQDYAAAFAGISNEPLNELLFLPYLMGERSPVNDPSAQGVLYGIHASHDQKAVTKAVLEGVCLSLRDCMSTARRLGVEPVSARVIGGGTKSRDWMQILSDVLGIKLYTINTSEGGGLGAVITAMVATGRFSGFEEACRSIIQTRAEFIPDDAKAPFYAEKYQRYQKLYASLKNAF